MPSQCYPSVRPATIAVIAIGWSLVYLIAVPWLPITAFVPHLIPLAQARAQVTIDHEKKDTKVYALFLNLKITSKLGAKEMIIYRSPHRWRIVQEVVPASRTIAVCDGETAWLYDVIGEKVGPIRKWNVSTLKAVHGEEQVYEHLRIVALSGLATIALPSVRAWKEFDTRFWRTESKYVGEDSIAGLQTIVYESKEPPVVRLWFGKEDGILRKQIIYKLDGKEGIRSTVTEIDKQFRITESFFNFKPPEGSIVNDQTNELMELLKERKEEK